MILSKYPVRRKSEVGGGTIAALAIGFAIYMQFITDIRQDEAMAATLARLAAEEAEQEAEAIAKHKADEMTKNRRELATYEITAYTIHPSETGKRPGDPAYGITASGKRVERGDAACPPSMAFGTRLYIAELDRTFTCVDRGGAIKGKRLDLYMASRSSAIEFGRRTMEVEILGE